MLNFTIKIDKHNKKYLETNIRGKSLLSISPLNKGTAFTKIEREQFGLKGKLPNRVETLDEQVNRAYQQYRIFDELTNRNMYLNSLLDTNQTLFYKLVIDNVEEMLPTIYTPIVGSFVKSYNRRFMNPRGLYISYEDQDDIEEILENRSNPDIKLIVVSDGEGVLGIGDQGIGAMAIPIAKLMVYSIFGGINPSNTLPIMLDAGTNNKKLLEDPLYLGWHQPRIEGNDYNVFIDKFIKAIQKKFPHVFLHWEDFGRTNAYRNLIKYRDQTCSFNDDIQGTGVVALAAILSAAKKTGTSLAEQRIVVFGGGTAGMGIVDNIFNALKYCGSTDKQATQPFWIVDRHGLVTEVIEEITPAQKRFVRFETDIDEWNVFDKKNITLLEVIQHVKPTILIGASAQHGAFTKAIISEMAKHVKHPTILPLSNPNELAEATPEAIIHWTSGKALVATGSPFNDVTYENKCYLISQCNNFLAFPGIGLSITSIKAKRLTQKMLYAASEALAKFSYEYCDCLLPKVKQIKAASKAIAIAVAKTAIEENLAGIPINKPIEELIEDSCWEPCYLPYRCD